MTSERKVPEHQDERAHHGQQEPQDQPRISQIFAALEHIREKSRLIVIEGVIGAGKTTLARMLGERLGADLVLEEFEENPFLQTFYEDRQRWAFHTQLSFLASRFKQQKILLERDLFRQIVVTDYTFEKDRIFAHVNLTGDELQLYDTLYRIIEPNTPEPDVVIFLQASVDMLLENIRRRARPYEASMEPSYLAALTEAYNYYFYRYSRSPLLIVNREEVDFVENPQVLEELITQIASIRYRGATFFRPVRTDLYK